MGLFDWLTGEPYPVLRKVIVHTKTERSFRGALWARRRGYLLLRDVEMLSNKAEAIKMPGETLIESDNVDFVQVL